MSCKQDGWLIDSSAQEWSYASCSGAAVILWFSVSLTPRSFKYLPSFPNVVTSGSKRSKMATRRVQTRDSQLLTTNQWVTSQWVHPSFIYSLWDHRGAMGLIFRMLSNQSSPLFPQIAAVIPSALVWAPFRKLNNIQISWSFTCRKQNLVESYDWWLYHLLQAETILLAVNYGDTLKVL